MTIAMGGGFLSGVGSWSLVPSPQPPPRPGPGIWGGVTCHPDADRRAFLRSMARVGGHAAVDALILMSYLREEQHRAGGKRQGCALVGKRGQRPSWTLISGASHPVSQPALVGKRGRRPSWTLHLWSHTPVPQPALVGKRGRRPSWTLISRATHPASQPAQALRITHILYPVDLRRGLGRGGTGQGHGAARSHCPTFRLNQQLNALWRHRLWVGTDMKSARTPGSRPEGPGINPCLPESQTGPSLPPCSPLTRSWMGAVFMGLRRGRPRLKVQEKVGWVGPP